AGDLRLHPERAAEIPAGEAGARHTRPGEDGAARHRPVEAGSIDAAFREIDPVGQGAGEIGPGQVHARHRAGGDLRPGEARALQAALALDAELLDLRALETGALQAAVLDQE